MARQKVAQVENNFTLGLVTERTELGLPPNSASEASNVIFDDTGKVTRRPAYDIETGHANVVVNSSPANAYVEFVWTSVGGDGDRSFLVCQTGDTLRFYDISDSPAGVSANIELFTIVLTAFVPPNSPLTVATVPCSFTNGRGRLIVTNRACNPFYVEYNSTLNTITTTGFDVRFRDFEGLVSEHSTDITSRPASITVATAETTLPRHLYNLYNQGWDLTDALTQWDAARTDLPSNADTTGLYRASETDSFDQNKVAAKSPGNTAAPKGHFILNLGYESRQQASGVVLGEVLEVVAGGTPSRQGLFTSGGITSPVYTQTNLSAFSDGVSSQASSVCYRDTVTGTVSGAVSFPVPGVMIDYGTTVIPTRVRLYPSSDQGFGSFTTSNSTGVLSSIAISIRASNTGFSTSSSGFTTLGSVTLGTDQNTPVEFNLTNTAGFRYVWAFVTLTMTSIVGSPTITLNCLLAELEVSVLRPSSFNRPELSAFFAGRAWYAANSYSDRGTYLYFSQVIERPQQIGLCFQKNDPTAEVFFDLLPDDGGAISIPEIANIVSIFPMRSALVVLASNGTWVIRGGSSEGFSATSFRVEKISSVGCVARLSVTDVRGIPMWWGEDAIYTIEYDPNFNAYQQKSLTDERIRSFYRAIPENNRRFAKGAYDPSELIVKFVYNDDPSFGDDDHYVFNKELHYNVESKAWYHHSIPVTGPLVRGIVQVSDANHVYRSTTKYPITWTSTSQFRLSFAEMAQDSYYDWDDHSVAFSLPLFRTSFSSYFVTAPQFNGEAQRFVQGNYVFVFMNTVASSSCKMQGLFDSTTNGNSGKWGTKQQVYNTLLNTNRRVSQRKMKVRGKGRSMQLRFESTEGSPFEIIGWSILKTMNGDV